MNTNTRFTLQTLHVEDDYRKQKPIFGKAFPIGNVLDP